ncbi:MAG: glycosyltransferase [Propionibacteriaceae bacterium]|jgi:glycosyltransferase involved in cell wall biosynthesis|nr:glycosyltransferase [Propionibacteriaceae bacterium]
MPDKLHIGLFTDDFFPDSGGIGRSVQLQLTELANAGHDVTLFAPRSHFTAPEIGKYARLPCWRVPLGPSYLCMLASTPLLANQIAAKYPLDVIHTQTERGAIHLGAMLSRRLGIPHVHSFHSNYAGAYTTSLFETLFLSLAYLPYSSAALKVFRHGLNDTPLRPSTLRNTDSPYDRLIFRPLAYMASQVTAFTSPAQFMVDAIDEASGGVVGARGYVVPSGVNDAFLRVERQRPFSKTTRFISSGRLDGVKRIDAIIDAFALLDDENAELVIVGAGPREGALKAQAKKVAKGKVNFVGHIGDTMKLAQTVADADVFVLASYHFDTQGMVLAEAAAVGTPILYCDDRLHVGIGANALLTGHGPADLAQGMRALAADPDRRIEMGKVGMALTDSLTSATMCERYVAAYREAIAQFPTRGQAVGAEKISAPE